MPSDTVPHPIPFVIASKQGRKPKAEPRNLLDDVRYCASLLEIMADETTSHGDALAMYGAAKLLDRVASELTKKGEATC